MRTVNDYWNRPCAAAGLNSYRYRGPYGFIMIGATDNTDALKKASCSTDAVSIQNLERWNGQQYVAATQ